MALTASVKNELSHLDIRSASARKAEAAAMLRFTGGLQIVSGRVVIQAEVDFLATARRLNTAIAELYRRPGEVLVLPAGHAHPGWSYLVRIVHGGEALARQIGLLDSRGNPVRGLPPAVVNGTLADVEAIWRGAFLAQGTLTEPGRSSAFGVTCPGPEAALALLGAARRLGIDAKTRDMHGMLRVVLRDDHAVARMLSRMGAPGSLAQWQDLCRHRDATAAAAATRAVNFETSNQARSAEAARVAVSGVERALQILGEDVLDSLKQAGELRIANPQASLEELGRLADPPLSKDTIAGRIRRLLRTADKRAAAQGLPRTGA